MPATNSVDIQQDKETVSESTVMAQAARDGASIGGATRKDPKKAAWFAKVWQQIVSDMGQNHKASGSK